MVGLDAAGKTTILYKLKLGEGKSCVGLQSLAIDPFALTGRHF